MLTAMLQRAFRPVLDDALGNAIAQSQQTRAQQFKSVERLRGLAVAEGLRHLFDQKHFSICQLEACIAAARVIPDGEVMRILRPLHCRDWADMPRELRDEVFSQTLAMFGVGGDL